MPLDQLTDEQFERHAFGLLLRASGADGLARFRRLNRAQNRDYTRDRAGWQSDLTIDQIVQSIEHQRT